MAQRARAVAHDVPDGRHVGSVAGDRGRAGGARMPCQDFVEAGPSDHALTIPPRQPPAPDSPYLIGEPTRTPWSGGRRPDRAISPGGARQLVASLGTPASSLHQPSAGTSACAMIAISDQMVSGQGIVICRVRAVRLQHGVCNLKPHGAALLAKLCLDLIEFLDLAGKDPTVAAVASACYPIEASAPEPCGSDPWRFATVGTARASVWPACRLSRSGGHRRRSILADRRLVAVDFDPARHAAQPRRRRRGQTAAEHVRPTSDTAHPPGRRAAACDRYRSATPDRRRCGSDHAGVITVFRSALANAIWWARAREGLRSVDAAAIPPLFRRYSIGHWHGFRQ